MEEKLIELKGKAEVTRLRNFGFTKSGACGGNASVLKPYLDQIYSGNLLDEKDYKRKSPEEIESIEKDIQVIGQQLLDAKNKINHFNTVVIASLELRKEDYEAKLQKYIDGSITQRNMGGTLEIFNLPKFVITSFFMLMLSVFIFLFYVAVVYKALFMTPQDILINIQEGNWGISLLPHWNEVMMALTTNSMVLFAPFIFFGFGYAMHLLIDTENKIKYLYVIAVIAVTFLLDYLLADQIHKRVNDALAIIDSPPGSFKDIIIVLIMGFVVYIIWSIIFHNWMEELNKLNIPNRLRKLIEAQKKEIQSIKKEVSDLNREIDVLNQKISDKNKLLSLQSVPISSILNSLSEFTQGWLSFISGLDNHDDLLNECNLTYKVFLESKGMDNFKFKADN